MLGTGAVALAVAASLPPREQVPMVLDPVLLSSSGGVLLDDAGRTALREELLPRATLVTPNVAELASLLGVAAAGTEAELIQQGRALLELGPRSRLVKDGRAGGRQAAARPLLEPDPVRRLS